jgi:hypothetical protein
VTGRAGAMRAITSSIPRPVCPRQGRQRPTPRFSAAGAGGVTTVEKCVGAAAKLRPATRAHRRYIAVPYHCADKAGIFYSAPLSIRRVVLLLINVCPRQGRRRPAPRFSAAGAGGIAAVKLCVGAAAKLRPATQIHCRYIAALVTLPLYR